MTRTTALALLLCLVLTDTARAKHAQGGYHATITSDHLDGDVREVLLSNGLKILLKEDHAAPVATLMVYYRVGSRNEHVGNTGSTHLLEHLQFKGTKKFSGKAAVWGTLSRIGASFNATTAQDRTNFFETVPSDQLRFAVELEADRMRNSTFTDADRASEMTVVRNELERGENEPGTLVNNLSWSTSFIAHPYHVPVIGWRSDVENVPTEQLRRFYDTYYQPDNAVVVAVGDFKSDDVLQLMVRNFGVFPGNHQFPAVYTTEEPQRGERRAVIQKPGELPLLEMGWHLPPIGSPDAVPLKVLQLILSGGLELSEFGEPLAPGISNRLYQALVETGIATGADMSYQLMLDPSLGALEMELRPGVSHEAAEKALRAVIAKLRDEPVTETELQRAKNRARASFELSQDATFGQAAALGYFGLLYDWRFVRNFPGLVDKVTAADVQRVARSYFTDDGATVVWFLPTHDQPQGADLRRDPLHPPRWAAYRETADMQADMRGPAEVRPAVKKKTLPNGLRIIVQENHSNPTLAIAGAVLAGSALEEPAELDLSAVTADLMERGTTKHTKLALAAELEDVGASLSLQAGSETVGISALAVKTDLDRVLDVLAEELLSPAFSDEEMKKVVDEHIAATLQSEDSTRVKAERALMQSLYPKGHPLYIDSAEDVIASLRKMTPEQARGWYRRFYGPDRTILTIVGDVNADDVFARIESRLGSWARVGGPPVEAARIPPNREAKRIDVVVPDKASVDIVEGIQGQFSRTDPGYYPAMLANYVLGAAGTSRLFTKVRNDMGLTYDISSSLEATTLAGPWTISLSVNPAVIDKALGAVQEVLHEWHTNGITQKELDDAKTEITGLYKVSLASNHGLASVMNLYEVLGLGAEYVLEHPKRIRAVTLDEVNRSIRRDFHPEGLVTVVSGTIPGGPPAAHP